MCLFSGTRTNTALCHSAPGTSLISVDGSSSTLKYSVNAFESVKAPDEEGTSPANGEGNIVNYDNGNRKFSLVDFMNVHVCESVASRFDI